MLKHSHHVRWASRQRCPPDGRRLPAGAVTTALSLTLTLSQASCVETVLEEEGAAGQAGVTVADSAGAEIVTISGPEVLETLPLQRLTDIPEVRLGVVDGDEPYQFHRLGGARRRSDGSIVVLNGANQELRAFDVAGRYLWTAGGLGDGPGELRQVIELGVLRGDSVAVWERVNQRVSVFAPDGSYERSWDTHLCSNQTTFQALRADACLLTVGFLADGSLVVMSLPPYTGRAPPPSGGPMPGEPVEIGATSEGWYRAVTTLRQGDYFYAYRPELGRVGFRRLFGGEPVWATGRERMAYGRTDEGEIHLKAGPDLLERIVRFDWPPQPVEEPDIAVYRDHDWGEEAPFAEQWLEAFPASPTKPYHGPILLDRDDRLWVREVGVYRIAPPDRPLLWTVFSREGQPIMRVELPGEADFLLYDLGEDWVLGREVDEYGVEYVVLYPLVEASTSSGPGG